MTVAPAREIRPPDIEAPSPSNEGPFLLGVPAWVLFGGYALLLMCAYAIVSAGPRNVILTVGTLVSAAAFAFGIVTQRPARPLAFWLFFAGLLCLGLGATVYYGFYGLLRGVVAPYPSAAEGFYIAAYGFFFAAITQLVRGRATPRDFAVWVDTAIAVVGIALVEYVFVIHPYLFAPGTPLLTRIVSVAQPIGDVVIIGVLVRLFVSPGSRSSSFRFLAAGFALFALCDAAYAIFAANGTYTGGLIDIGWLLGLSFFAMAGLHPAVRDLARGVQDTEARPSVARFGALATIAFMGPSLTLYVDQRSHDHGAIRALTIGSGLIFLLVIVRMGGLVRRLADSRNKLKDADAARIALTRRTLWASENDRDRLASEIHDGPVQQLTALSYRIEALGNSFAKQGGIDTDGFAPISRDLSAEIGNLRRFMAKLRPGALIERGLEAAVTDYLATALKSTDIESRVTCTLVGRPEHEVETIVYRVIQEAVANTVKHAYATQVVVALSEDNENIYLSVSDNGRGFLHEPKMAHGSSLGLHGMKERVEMSGGTFKVASSTADGTTISASIPMKGTR